MQNDFARMNRNGCSSQSFVRARSIYGFICRSGEAVTCRAEITPYNACVDCLFAAVHDSYGRTLRFNFGITCSQTISQRRFLEPPTPANVPSESAALSGSSHACPSSPVRTTETPRILGAWAVSVTLSLPAHARLTTRSRLRPPNEQPHSSRIVS